MIEQITVDTITNAGMGLSFILYLIYDRQVVLKKMFKRIDQLEGKIDYYGSK